MRRAEKNLRFFIRWTFSTLLIFLFFLVEFQFGAANILSLNGKKGIPYFDSQGKFKIIYINPKGGMNLAAAGEETFQKMSIQAIHDAHNINFIGGQKDKDGNMWLVWEERESGRSDIYVGQLKNERIVKQKNITADQRGFNFSPSIGFSFRNELWAAWINYVQKKYTVQIKNVTCSQSWKITPSSNSSVHSPHIIIGGSEKIWLFWVGKLRNCDEILYTFFDGQTWKKPSSLNQNSDVPHLAPSVHLDFNGFPHALWSAYDGDDYELYYSSWDGKRWKQEAKITENQETADISPSLSLLMNTIPLVSWVRYRNQKREICLAYKIGNKWSSVIPISEEKGAVNSLELVTFRVWIGILWQTDTEIKAALIPIPGLQDLFFLRNKNFIFPQILDLVPLNILALDRDKYIGFGDSITYGIINLQPAPNKGYVPRLETLIDENIRESQVVNQGVPGEKTAEGLSRINSVINTEQAKTIFLMEGTNDAKDTEISMDTTAFNLKKMAERCLDFGMKVFLASIIPKDPWEGLLKDRILDLNKEIESIASELDINFVNQFNFFIKDSDRNDALYSDATHPNEEGYQLMAETWYTSLVSSMPSIELDKTSLSFTAIQGQSVPSPQIFKVRNSGEARLRYQISDNKEWISISPENGDSRGEWDDIEVSVDISNLTPGSYQGSITVTSNNASNSPQMLTINLTVQTAMIELDKTSLSFEGIKGSSSPSPQIFKIRNSGAGTLNYNISDNRDWLSVSPASGDSKGEWDDIEVSIDISNLTPGSYQGSITVTSDNASNSPQMLTINLTVQTAMIELDKTSLSFEATGGEANPPPQIFKIRNSGAGTLNYNISDNRDWLSVSPASGDSKGEWDDIEVSIDISNLSNETYQGRITVISEDAANNPQALTIHLKIFQPMIELDKTSLSFEGIKGSSSPSPQIFKIRNSGAGTLNYNISDNRDWLSVSPASGDSKGEWDDIEVSIDISNLSKGSHQGKAIITSNQAANSPQKLTIALDIQDPPLFSPLNFQGEKKKNRSLSQLEYINVLTWEANPKNKNIIEKYKIYLVEGANMTLLKEFDTQTFEYWHRKVKKDKVYKYGLTAVDIYGRESEPVYIEVK